jgi:hypothetical protein
MWGAILAFATYRVWQAFAGPPIGWNDSLDYARSAVWAGTRPPLVPAVLAFAGSATTFVAIQVAVGVAAWVTLALVVSRSMPTRWRFPAVVVILGFASTTAVVRWDRSVLSESLAMSALALLLAALLHASDGPPSWWKVTALLGAGALFASVKDAHVWVVWLLAIVVAVDAVARGRGTKAVTAALGLAVCAGVFLGGSLSAHRADEPVTHVYDVRVFPYPDRVSWFTAHGMPNAAIVRDYARNTDTPRGEAPVVAVDITDTRVQPLVRWLHSDGERVYAQWLLAHPWTIFAEPFRSPERAFNFANGDIGMYSAPGRTEIGVVDAVLFPSAVVIVALAGFGFAIGMRSNLHRRSWWWMVVAFGAIGVVHMLIAWHGDGMETTRHVSIANAQTRLCVLVLVVAAVAELSVTWRDGFLRRHAGTRTERGRREELARPQGSPRSGDAEGSPLRGQGTVRQLPVLPRS